MKPSRGLLHTSTTAPGVPGCGDHCLMPELGLYPLRAVLHNERHRPSEKPLLRRDRHSSWNSAMNHHFLTTCLAPALILVATGLGNGSEPQPGVASPAGDPLPSWNDGPARRTLL